MRRRGAIPLARRVNWVSDDRRDQLLLADPDARPLVLLGPPPAG